MTDQTPYAEGLARAVPAGGAANAPAAAAGPAAPPAPTDAEGDRHGLRQQLAVDDGENGADGELLRRLGDVLDRVDPMPTGLVAAGRAVFTADTADTANTDASTGGGPPVPLPVEAPEPAGGATAPIPVAPPAHHATRRRRRSFWHWVFDLIGRPA